MCYDLPPSPRTTLQRAGALGLSLIDYLNFRCEFIVQGESYVLEVASL